MISIIIPALNEEQYLPGLLESIREQDYRDYEIIVADNNSSDRTLDIARRFGCRVVKGGIPAESRQAGAKAALHDLLFLDADVILPRGFLCRFLAQISKQELAAASCFVKPTNGGLGIRWFYAMKNFGNTAFNWFYVHCNGQCFFIKRDVFFRSGGFRKFVHGEEHDLMRRVTGFGKYRMLPGIYVLNHPRRAEQVGPLRLFLLSLYAGILRFFGRDMTKYAYRIEWGNFKNKY